MCVKCLGFTKAVFKAVSGRPDMPWFCTDCTPKTLNIIKESKSIEDRCSDFFSGLEKKIEGRLTAMEQNLQSMRDDMGAMKEAIMKKVAESGTAAPHVEGEKVAAGINKVSENKGASDNLLNSLQGRMDRKNNVVFYNIPESPGNLIADRIKYDRAEIKKVASELEVDLDDKDILFVSRLGNKGIKKKVHGEDVEVPRIVVATFPENVKPMIMKNAYKLQFAKTDYLKKISIKHDMTKEERAIDNKLRWEAKERQGEECNKNFLILVRGPVWDRKIVRVRKHRTPEAVAVEPSPGVGGAPSSVDD